MALISACSPMVDSRGNLPDDDAVLQVQPGIDDRSQVAKLLGSPSTIATFNDKTWYYVSKRTETTAFFPSDITDQQVLVSTSRPCRRTSPHRILNVRRHEGDPC